jgi:hypothetical protein
VAVSLWFKDGKLLFDGDGKLIFCEECPCGGPCSEYPDVFVLSGYIRKNEVYLNNDCSGAPVVADWIRQKANADLTRDESDPCRWCATVPMEESSNEGASWTDAADSTFCVRKDGANAILSRDSVDIDTQAGDPDQAYSDDSGCYDEITGLPPDGGTTSTQRVWWSALVS